MVAAIQKAAAADLTRTNEHTVGGWGRRSVLVAAGPVARAQRFTSFLRYNSCPAPEKFHGTAN